MQQNGNRERYRCEGRIKVITDIDDCVKSSGGVKLMGIALGGIDRQYDRGQFYPGTFQFAFELSRQHVNRPSSHTPPPSSPAASTPLPLESVAVLTARAREFKFALALKPTDHLCQGFQRTGSKYGYPSWGIGLNDVYYGSVVEWIFQHRKGQRKASNFNLLLENDRLLHHGDHLIQYIFIGDTGDRDEDAAERMIQRHGSDTLLAVFLHVVSENPLGVSSPLPEDRVFLSVPIFYFRTYVSAGWKAYQNGYISRDALQCIIDESLQDLEYDHSLSSHSLSHSCHHCCLNCLSCCSGAGEGDTKTHNRLRLESRWRDVRSDIQLIEKECPATETSLRQTLISAESKLLLSENSDTPSLDPNSCTRPATAPTAATETSMVIEP